MWNQCFEICKTHYLYVHVQLSLTYNNLLHSNNSISYNSQYTEHFEQRRQQHQLLFNFEEHVLSRGLKTFMVLLSPLLVDVAVPSFVTLRNSTETLSSLCGVLLTGLPWAGGVIRNQTAVHQGCMRQVLLTQNPNRHNHQKFLCQWNTNAPERDVGFIFRNKVKSEIRCHSN